MHRYRHLILIFIESLIEKNWKPTKCPRSKWLDKMFQRNGKGIHNIIF